MTTFEKNTQLVTCSNNMYNESQSIDWELDVLWLLVEQI